MIEYEEFASYCSKGSCLRHTIYNEKTCLRESKRKRCFDKFLKTQEKKKNDPIVDERWSIIRYSVLERDGFQCRLTRVLSVNELIQAGVGFDSTGEPLDVAHIVSRSQSSKLYYDMDNLLSLRRIFHSRLDKYKDPITGKSILKEDRDYWFIRIIGKSLFERLQNEK